MRKHRRLTVYLGFLLFAVFATNWRLNAAPSAQGPLPTTVPLSEEAYVPAGAFPMGCSPDITDGIDCALDAQPIHLVYVDAFYIDKTEVSNAQYADCVNAGGCPPPIENSSPERPEYFGNPQFDNYPVIHMDWDRANAYCQWVSKRLPTEAEWEKAARGTDLRLFPWGNDKPTCDKMNFSDAYIDKYGYSRAIICVGDTAPVNSYADYPSPYGVLNMTGNAQEWVNDLYLRRYYASSPYYNPQGPEATVSGEHHIRGGAWRGFITHVNAWVRLDEADIYTTELNGFRCARPGAQGTPTPSPTPTPTATPTPYAATSLGPDGGVLWMSTDKHLTLLAIKENALNARSRITLSYEARDNSQGELLGINHFFTLHADNPGSSTWLPPHFPDPVRLTLGYQESGAIIPGTLTLYRLTEQGWITDDITTTIESPGYARADIQWPGVYGLLGYTNKVYLPILIRH